VFSFPAGLDIHHCRFSALADPFFASAGFTTFAGPDRLNRRVLFLRCSQRTRQADRSTASLEVYFPSAHSGRAASSKGSRPLDHPASTLRALPKFRRRSDSLVRRRPCGFPPCVSVRAAHTARLPSRLTPARSASHSPRSLFRAAFRYPFDRTLSQPGRIRFLYRLIRQRSWDSGCPSQFSLAAGRRISAVHPHLPLSEAFAREPADFYGLPVAEYGNSFLKNEFENGTDGANDQTGFWVMLPRTSRADDRSKIERCAPANPAMGFFELLSGVSDAFSEHASVTAARHRAVVERRQSPQPCLSLAAIRSWVSRRPIQEVRSRSATKLFGFKSQSSNGLRHPCRRRPFSVFGRFAPGQSEQLSKQSQPFRGRASVSDQLPV